MVKKKYNERYKERDRQTNLKHWKRNVMRDNKERENENVTNGNII